MGLNIGDIVPRTALDFKDLKGKIIAIDAFNTIYQFLSTIRQSDGTPLMNSKNEVTSHLSGLFYRNINLLQEGLKLVYVFDGKPPALKWKTHEKRQEQKDRAREKYETAVGEEDVDGMGKYAKQLSLMNDRVVQQSKELLEAMGIAVIQSPSEGESQAAELTRIKGEDCAYAVGSQDYDSLLFGATRLIQNLTLARKRKTAGGQWVYISPEIIELEEVLNRLQINRDQLICLGILVGTDYNPKGIKGIGQKKALEIVRKIKAPVKIFDSVRINLENQPEEDKFDWQEIFELFHKPNIIDVDKIVFPKFNPSRVKEILLENDFSEERIDNNLDKIKKINEEGKQKTLF